MSRESFGQPFSSFLHTCSKFISSAWYNAVWWSSVDKWHHKRHQTLHASSDFVFCLMLCIAFTDKNFPHNCPRHFGVIGRKDIYRVRQIKVIPCRVLLISQQRIRIFTRKFTRIFLIHIYVKIPNYVKLSQHLTKLCHFNRANPTFCNV